MTAWNELRIHVARFRNRDPAAVGVRLSQDVDVIAIDVVVPAGELSITTATIPEGSDIRVEGTLETKPDEILLRVHVSTIWSGECRRCLDNVTGEVEIDIETAFIDDASGAPGAAPTDGDRDGETYSVVRDMVDIGSVVRDEIMLVLPLSPLCRTDCDGPDPERFGSIEPQPESEVPESETPADPRWAALSQLTFDEE